MKLPHRPKKHDRLKAIHKPWHKKCKNTHTHTFCNNHEASFEITPHLVCNCLGGVPEDRQPAPSSQGKSHHFYFTHVNCIKDLFEIIGSFLIINSEFFIGARTIRVLYYVLITECICDDRRKITKMKEYIFILYGNQLPHHVKQKNVPETIRYWLRPSFFFSVM